MGLVGRRLAFLALFVTAALACPASGWAATGQLQNGVMIYTADAGESNAVTFTTNQFGSPTFEVVDQPNVNIVPTPPCFNGGQDNIMECPQDGGGTGQVVLFQASLGDGNDTITLLANLPTSIGAGGGADTMTGGPAADFLRGGQQDDAITGGGGNDQLVGDDPGVAGGGNDALDGGDGNDTEDGQDGADTVRGGLGDDTLAGGGGNDLFPAEAVSDGVDVVNGGDGVDTATYAARTEPLTLSLDDQANDGLAGNAFDNVHTDVENLIGGSAADTISGSGGANSLDGGPGNDSLDGLDADDAITGGPGDDTAAGGAGDDSLGGGDGDDDEAGGPGNDTLGGGDGNDKESGGDGTDTMNGDAGDDSLDGGAGPDVFAGGDGTDTGSYQSRTNGVTVTLDGNAGDGEPGEGDNVQGDVENVLGGTGADTFIGSAAGNTLDGGAGEDYSDGGAGSDNLVGGDAGDVLRSRGSGEPDTIACGPGPDFVIAKANDTIAADCDRADRGVNQRPKRRDSAVVLPTTGTLQMSPAGIVRRVPLQDKVVLPLKSVVDTVAGAVKVQSAPTARRIETASLEDGAFDITQTRAKVAITQFSLQGGDFSVCPTAGRRASAAAGKKASTRTVRVLWANAKGKFRTKGRTASATVRGTQWETVDRCDGTLIKVRKGAVAVRDQVKKKTVVVKAGDSYLARR
jgi:Ca2+-binding RTX toxin-like protein